MTQEDKILLAKDLFCRALSGVKVNYKGNVYTLGYNMYLKDGDVAFESYPMMYFLEGVEEVKPYLRPMSSMTEEEKKDILQSLNIHGDIDNEGNLLLGVECNIITLKICKRYLGELNKRMFDVCHMIEKGLALEAPEGMYKTEQCCFLKG